MEIILNNDYTVPANKRKFTKLSSKKEFLEKVKIWNKKHSLENSSPEEYLACYYPSMLKKDFKYDFVLAEDVYVEDLFKSTKDALMGIQTLSNELTFCGYIIGGEGHGYPFMYVISYFDGKNMRVYVPTKGNLVNRDFKCPIGNENINEDIDEEILEKIAKKYLKEGRLYIYDENHEYVELTTSLPSDYFDVAWDVSYVVKYCKDTISGKWNYQKLMYEELYNAPIDWDLIKEDIETHFVEA